MVLRRWYITLNYPISSHTLPPQVTSLCRVCRTATSQGNWKKAEPAEGVRLASREAEPAQEIHQRFNTDFLYPLYTN